MKGAAGGIGSILACLFIGILCLVVIGTTWLVLKDHALLKDERLKVFY